MLILLIGSCVVQLITLLLVAALFVAHFMPSREARLERHVEEHMERGGMDEGFENIMAFSVKGHTGFNHEQQYEE